MKKIRTLLIMLLAALTLGATLPTTTASAAKHVTTPKSVRGTWVAKSKHFKQRLKMTKYTLTVTRYHKNGRVNKVGSFTARGNKTVKGLYEPSLYVSKHKSKKGYWTVALNQSNDAFMVKKVRHHGKVALRNYYPTFNPKVPMEHKIRYFYRVK
ncbi:MULTISPECIES: hypothetical protein [Levilactobacillus]|jgi:hypothetical protein|uniref:hypothetical protein n=1 Tax=Levilactobacillus TaxID=2767886 RepID=UPI00194DE539|nr:hypothetical protein [Levilactobacillus sp. 244-2]